MANLKLVYFFIRSRSTIPKAGQAFANEVQHSYQKSRTERIMYNPVNYSAVDIETELEKFIADPVKCYANETVDLFIPALALAFKIKADVFSINATGKIWASTVGTLDDPQFEAVFARTAILHVDPALPIKHEVKTETNRPVFMCPLCYETFAGPLRLSRHLKLKTETIFRM